ncbi:hypothetical protein MASR2M17_23040 [Aminivibrio sp.]
MGEVDDVHDAPYEAEPRGNEGIEKAVQQSVDENLKKITHRGMSSLKKRAGQRKNPPGFATILFSGSVDRRQVYRLSQGFMG